MTGPTTYALGTVQTPTGSVTGVAMRNLSAVVTTVHLPDGTFVVPDATGTIVVPASCIVALTNSGWSLVASSNSPAVTVP